MFGGIVFRGFSLPRYYRIFLSENGDVEKARTNTSREIEERMKPSQQAIETMERRSSCDAGTTTVPPDGHHNVDPHHQHGNAVYPSGGSSALSVTTTTTGRRFSNNGLLNTHLSRDYVLSVAASVVVYCLSVTDCE